MKAIASNKKALRDYNILERIEAGIELKGCEVKSLRRGSINFKDSFARIEDGEVLLYHTHISPYAEASYLNVEPERVRKLLLHKRQIIKLWQNVSQKGLTLVPLRVYFNDRGIAKIELALCKGKKQYDRRDTIKRREQDRQLRKVLSIKRKGG